MLIEQAFLPASAIWLAHGAEFWKKKKNTLNVCYESSFVLLFLFCFLIFFFWPKLLCHCIVVVSEISLNYNYRFSRTASVKKIKHYFSMSPKFITKCPLAFRWMPPLPFCYLNNFQKEEEANKQTKKNFPWSHHCLNLFKCEHTLLGATQYSSSFLCAEDSRASSWMGNWMALALIAGSGLLWKVVKVS